MKNPIFYSQMALWVRNPAAWLACLLALLCSAPAWGGLSAYEARYSIYRNGKLIGKLDIELANRGGVWELNSTGSGTHGLARILRAKDREQVTGRVEDGQFVPGRHTRHTRVAGIDDKWESIFDWESNQVTVVHDGKKEHVLSLQGEALDPLSLKLEMRRRLEESNADLSFLMVEEDEIEEQNFRQLESEWLETALGCMETTPIEKVREKSTRYTRAWHAPALGNIEVRVEHGKVGGDHLEMRITELSFGGDEVLARPGCAAMQSANGLMTASDP